MEEASAEMAEASQVETEEASQAEMEADIHQVDPQVVATQLVLNKPSFKSTCKLKAF